MRILERPSPVLVTLPRHQINRLGEETEHLVSGDAAFAPSGLIHSIRNPGPDRLVVMVVLAPPPRK
jgi:mannose-6-phosphate isomerase-like protein (cupin superfamily)